MKKFTAHNILLNNGKRTLDDNAVLLGESAVWKSIEASLNLFFPHAREDRSRLRVVDLGCLEGGFAVEFARMGFDTLGIEVREENMAKCNYVKENLNLPNLQFVKDDVRNIVSYGKFDIVLCYGLLYHLNDPIDFLTKISDCNNKLMFLNTHFAPERDLRYKLGFLNNFFIAPIQKRTGLFEFEKNYRLSRLQLNEGYRGRWKKEWSKGVTQIIREKSLWSSYDNDKSFWLLKKDLTKALHKTGYDNVFEQFNYTGDIMPDNYTQFYNRAMFVAVKNE